MLGGVSTRPSVMPLESLVDVRSAANIVSRRIAVASEDIDKPSADALHVGSPWHVWRQREPLGILEQMSNIGHEVREPSTHEPGGV